SKPQRYYEEDSTEKGPPRVIVYGYDGLLIQPVAPPSPDYVPGTEQPPSLDYVPGLEHPPSPVEIPYVPEPELWDGDDEPSDDDDDDDTDDEDPEEEPFEDEDEEEHLAPANSSAVPIVDHILPAGDTEALEADEPTHAPGSPIIIPLSQTRLLMSDASSVVTYTSIYTDSKPQRYYEEDSTEKGPPRVIVYGYDGLLIQPVAPPSPDYVPGTEQPPSLDYVPGLEHPPSPVEIPYVPEPEARKTVRPEPPMSASMEACIARHVALPSPSLLVPSQPLPLPLPLTTSPTNTGAPLGYRAARIRMRALLTSTSRGTDIPEADMPPRKRACRTTPTLGFEIGESCCKAARTYKDDRALLRARVNTLFRDRPDHHRTTMLMDKEVMYAREAWAYTKDMSSARAAHVKTLETQVAALIAQT
nr:hypothetical protein [Tanacetum cinerariifolium]